mmetsp:Transcript_49833/g.75814  ORF Transcript_49833/g.75814 Transcript_49833/m.75814 type:complete len:310 (-) Transcript_49833:14-943(-)
MFTSRFVSVGIARSSFGCAKFAPKTYITCFSSTNVRHSSIQETQNILDRVLLDNKKIRLRNSLQIDPRYRITREEYFSKAKELDFSKEQAETFLHHLNESTVVSVVSKAKNFIFLKPDQLVKNVTDVVDAEATELQLEIKNLQKILEKDKIERDRLHSVKVPLDKRAERSASLMLFSGLTGMAGYFCLVARMTWWELSWDIVEPITYMITYSTATALLFYFCFTRVEYQYESLFHRMVEKRKAKLYRRNDFNIARYEELTKAIAENSKKLETMNLAIPPHAVFIDPHCDTTHVVLPEPEPQEKTAKPIS